MAIKLNYTRSLFFISILFFVIFSFLFFIHWQKLNENIGEIKKQNKENYESIYNKRDFGPFIIEFDSLNRSQVVVDAKEIDKINNHIKVLSEEVFRESNRAESIIDKDIDRLNLYMAIGIGFMTILGIFVPILVNLLGAQDLREKVNEIKEENKNFEKIIPKIEKANKDSKYAIANSTKALKESKKVLELETKINDLSEKTEKVAPEISNLALQSSISRFFNISPIVLTNAIRDQNFQDFVNLLTPIKNEFVECQGNKSHTINSNESFKSTIDDFILFLRTERFKFQSIFNARLDIKQFDKLIDLLTKLKESELTKEAQNYRNLIIHFDQLIELFTNKNVKDKPAA